jgi:Cof subfamily protein (haloacid dehalogenase superfamily)
MSKKLIAIDVDGTLLNDQHKVSSFTLDTLHKARDRGCQIILASGRGPQNGLPVMDEMGLEGWMITHNGAVTVDSRSKEVISRFPMTLEQVWPVIEYAREHQIHFDICTDFDQFIESLADEVAMMYERFGIKPIRLERFEGWEESVVKFTLFGNDEQLNRAFLEISPRLTDLNVIRSGIPFIDISHRLASKGNALKEVCETAGISREDVIAFGNYFNDVDMIQYAGIGIAMDNSPEGVKRAADQIAPSNNEDGVARTLKRLLNL